MEKLDKEKYVRVQDVTDPKLKAELMLMCATYGMVSHADFVKARCYDLVSFMNARKLYRHKQKVYMEEVMEVMKDYQKTIGRCFKEKEQFLFDFNQEFEDQLMPTYQWLEYQCASTLYIMRRGFEKFKQLPKKSERLKVKKENRLLRDLSDDIFEFVGKACALLICVEMTNLCYLEIIKDREKYGDEVKGAHWLAFPTVEASLYHLCKVFMSKRELTEMVNRHGVDSALKELRDLMVDTDILSHCINTSEILEV